MKISFSLVQKLSIFITIVICLQILGAGAQVDPTQYGGKLNFKVGDSVTYEYTTFIDLVKYPSGSRSTILENGTQLNYNITQGLKETFTPFISTISLKGSIICS